eukprot:366271-Chlamydomonas_euryale.AAC.6
MFGEPVYVWRDWPDTMCVESLQVCGELGQTPGVWRALRQGVVCVFNAHVALSSQSLSSQSLSSQFNAHVALSSQYKWHLYKWHLYKWHLYKWHLYKYKYKWHL